MFIEFRGVSIKTPPTRYEREGRTEEKGVKLSKGIKRLPFVKRFVFYDHELKEESVPVTREQVAEADVTLGAWFVTYSGCLTGERANACTLL